MRLFHFSDDPHIAAFVPRPVDTPAPRTAGMEWLNGPLVWAIDEAHQAMYLFPRECPRILVWPTATTSADDRAAWARDNTARMTAYVEAAWLDRLTRGVLYRYEFRDDDFDDLGDAGMWVSRKVVIPIANERITDFATALKAQDVDLRAVESLTPLRSLWDTTLHASGIRLRNAAGWNAG